jgi:redox-sensitive bicupin YhaK (pirin superfamily)
MKGNTKAIYGHQNIDNLIPGVRGQRAFPTGNFKSSDPFLLLDHIGPQKVGKAFRLDGTGHDHPHKGFETITFMLEGQLQHRDSLGNHLTLNSGDVQRMNAGSGIIHGGDMASDQHTERFHEVQLWINNPKSEKLTKPEVQNISSSEIPFISDGGQTVSVIAGNVNGISGQLKTKTPTQIARYVSEAKGSMRIHGLDKRNNTMIYVLKGELSIGSTRVEAFHLAILKEEMTEFTIHSSGKTEALILSGLPLKEPVAFGGPFVMNTQEEINQANIDFQLGKFGSIRN